MRPIRLLCLAVITALQACFTWEPLSVRPRSAEPRDLPYALRVTRTDGSRLTMLSPFVRTDTLFGRVVADTVAVPMADVRKLEGERFSVVRTVGVIAAIPAAFLVVYAVHCRDGRCEPQALN